MSPDRPDETVATGAPGAFSGARLAFTAMPGGWIGVQFVSARQARFTTLAPGEDARARAALEHWLNHLQQGDSHDQRPD